MFICLSEDTFFVTFKSFFVDRVKLYILMLFKRQMCQCKSAISISFTVMRILWAERVGPVFPWEKMTKKVSYHAYKYPKGRVSRRWSQALFLSGAQWQTKGQKLTHRKFHQNMMRNFFNVSIPVHWNRLPREAVEFPLFRIYSKPAWMWSWTSSSRWTWWRGNWGLYDL